jgi:two-component system sensor histidine kinase QseC
VVIARSDSSSGRDLPTPSVAQKDSHSAYDLKLPDGHRGRALAHVAVLPPDDPRGTITAVLAKETESLEQLETSVHRWLALVALAVVAVTLLVVWYSVSGGLKTVDDLADIAQRIDPDSPRETIDLQSLPAELRPVARKLISLLDGLWSALDRERRFARNVAHELRNPLAEARMLADVGGMAVSLEDAQDSMREVSVAVSELEQIVESLLAMARYEAGHARPQQEPVNLTETISRQLAILESAAKMRDLDIRVELPRERWILSDAELLKRLISNVIGNAVAHAPRSSTVEIQMAEDGAFCTMNQAPQLSTDELPKLGERFFRIDTGDGRTHAGLGLSLAQSIARILALDFEIRLDANSTLTARIHGFRRLPL